jgi:hypothetical protein
MYHSKRPSAFIRRFQMSSFYKKILSSFFLPGASFALLRFEGMNDGLVAIEAYCEEGPHRNVYLKKPFLHHPVTVQTDIKQICILLIAV